MAEQSPKRGRGPFVWVVLLAAVVLLAVVIFLFTRESGEEADGPPPELGPDTAQAAPASPNQPPTAQPTQLAGDPAAPPPEQAVAPASAGPGDVSFADESLTFKTDLPEGPANDPVLAYLRRDSEGYLKTMKSNARADFDRLKRAGAKGMPWEVQAEWKYTARAGNIVSLAGTASEFNGGAHPMMRYDTLIARADTGKKLDMADMLILKRSPSPAMMIALCEALKDAKMKRIKSATIMDDPIVCAGATANAKTEDAKLALAPSDKPGKFGGVYAYYEPYAVGPYAEGGYRLTVQQEIFAQDLKSEYRKLFDGKAPILPEDRF